MRLAVTTTVASLFLLPIAGTSAARAASTHRSTTATSEALRWSPPAAWLRGALCIHRHESPGAWHRAGVDWRGRRSPYYGGLQFLTSTWRAAGGKGLPSDWPAHEQLYRAWKVWSGDGGSWRQWSTHRRCGLA